MADSSFKIHSKRNLLHINISEIWEYRYLIFLFVRRDFVSVYKQTILGPLWFFIQPLFTTTVFTLVFGKFGGLSPSGIPTFLYYMSGIILWNYFADCVLKTSNTFTDNQGLFGKVYFPRLSVPISIILSNLIKFSVQFVLFFGIWFYFYLSGSVNINSTILLLPINIILMSILGIGFGILVSSLTTKYRDLRYLLQFGIQLLMYLTPGIIMSYESITINFPEFKWLCDFNPIYPVIECFKHGWINSGTFKPIDLVITSLFALSNLLVGILIFNRTEQNFMDTI